ncbi:aminotransferase class V-fold PLP-dependent enzyme [Fodinicola feengrottensis]|uniref:Aminotransferase class V-fold PLP-dependent enzyme n=1 Tax=Fodinicola feengrottensis TaxID=435914 RepID=A0ABN2I9M9_9ACTN
MTAVISRQIDALLPVVGGDLAAPLVTGECRPYANLDYAASAPALAGVASHVNELLPFYASVHRGAGYASQVSTGVYESARAIVANAFGARDDDVVVFTRNTTDAFNLLAGCVPADRGDVLVLDLEHHANLLPWRDRDYRCLPVSSTLEQTLKDLDSALAAAPAALVTVTGASNVTGELLPLEEIATIAHRYGARLAVDAAQLAPHRPIDLAAAGIDYLAFSGHKLYAPFGAGVLVGRRDWLDTGRPYLAGGGAVRQVTLTDTAWAPAPARHEGGTPNVLGAAALARACQLLAALPAGAQEAHEAALQERLLDGLAGLDGVRVHRIFPDSPGAIGVVTFSLPGYDPGLVAAYLSAEHGIGVRDGKFCAHPLLSRLGLAAGAIRASLGVGSCSDDVDRLVRALSEFLESGAKWTYAQVDGRWTPSPDPRPRPDWALGSTAGTSPCAN